jgi:surface antigen
MAHHYCSIVVCMAAAGLGAACLSAENTDPQVAEVGLTTSALSVCEEAVPANRNIDGIPSYAQCAASESAAIYSNNGVDTSTTQVSPDWQRTQWSGGYQCTELANRYFRFRWGVKWVPNGNAGAWCDTQPPANVGVVQTMAPVHGDLMVLAPGSCGAAQGTGHVTVVDEVNDTKLVVVEQNGARRGTYNLSCAKCFLHVMANDGVPMPATGLPPATPGTNAAGAAAPAAPTTPAQGAGGAAANPTDRPSRPRGPAAAAGAAAPAPSIPAASTPPVTAPVATTPTAPAVKPPIPSTPLVGSIQNGVAAGSGAAPLPSSFTNPTSTPAAQTEAGGCSVSGVGEPSRNGRPLLLGVGLLFGMVVRLRRRPRN